MNNYQNDIISYLDDRLKSKKLDCQSFLNELLNKFDNKDLNFSYGYILKNSTNSKLINLLIRKMNSNLSKDNLPLLIDFIILPRNENNFFDLKVLAIKTIAKYKDTSAVSSLLYCLNDKESNYKIRLASAEALGKIGDKNAFDSLTNIVYDDKEKSAYMKESAVTALGMLGDNRAVDVFSSIIGTKQMFLDKFSYLKERIIEAMSNLDIARDKKALEILKNSILDSSKQIRINTIETLMNSDIPQSYDIIYERLKYDDDFEVKQNALIALYNISDRTILDEVINGEFSKDLKEYAKNLIDEYEEIDE